MTKEIKSAIETCRILRDLNSKYELAKILINSDLPEEQIKRIREECGLNSGAWIAAEVEKIEKEGGAV